MGTKQEIVRNVKNPPRIPGRMKGREIQSLEIIIIIFNLRPVFNGKSHSQKNTFDLLPKDSERMGSPPISPFPGKREIDDTPRHGGGIQFLVQFSQRSVDVRFQLIEFFSRFRFFFGRKRLQVIKQLLDVSFAAAQIEITEFLQVLQSLCVETIFIELAAQTLDLGFYFMHQDYEAVPSALTLLAFSTIRENVFGAVTARSAKTLRSSSICRTLSP